MSKRCVNMYRTYKSKEVAGVLTRSNMHYLPRPSPATIASSRSFVLTPASNMRCMLASTRGRVAEV
jgi:hypothetical protein